MITVSIKDWKGTRLAKWRTPNHQLRQYPDFHCHSSKSLLDKFRSPQKKMEKA